VSIRVATSLVAELKVMLAFSVAMLTTAVTSGNWFNAFSSREEQDAQCIPVICKSACCWVAMVSIKSKLIESVLCANSGCFLLFNLYLKFQYKSCITNHALQITLRKTGFPVSIPVYVMRWGWHGSG
jgi:hypothetical protein